MKVSFKQRLFLHVLVSCHFLGSIRLIQCADDTSVFSSSFSRDSNNVLLSSPKDDPLHPNPPNPEPYQVTYDDGTKSPLIQIRTRGKENEGAFTIYEETMDGYTVKPCAKSGKYEYMDVDEKYGSLVETGLIAGIDDPIRNKVTVEAAKRSYVIQVQRMKSSSSNIFQGADETRRALLRTKDSAGEGAASTSLMESKNAQARRRTAITSGTLKNLVIPFRFSDHTGRTMPSRSDLNILMNNVGPNAAICPTGSVRDVYLQSSFNQLDIESTVIDWVTIDYTEAQCAAGASGLSTTIHSCITNALDKAVASGVNFGDYDLDNNGRIDGITFFHSGYAAESGGVDQYGTSRSDRIWSHKWAVYTQNWTNNGVRVYDYHINPALYGTSGSNIGRIGVVAHETGHFLGLPDLYDYGDDTYGDGNGIGSYGLMANSWGFFNNQYYPPLMSAWSKYKLEWVSPTIVSVSGTYSLGQACDNADMILISTGFPSGEYLLIENRQPCGFEAAMPQGGLAIFHIDDNANNIRGYPGQGGWPGNGNHYEVALLQADGFYDLERRTDRGDSTDLFHAGGVNSIGPNGTSNGALNPNTNAYQNGNIVDTEITISNISAAGSTMTFDITIGSDTPAPTRSPTRSPTKSPTRSPTKSPTRSPTKSPTRSPTKSPIAAPVGTPPTASPTASPTGSPIDVATPSPTRSPIAAPTSTCVDTTLMLIFFTNKGKKVAGCDFIARNPSRRCNIAGISAACPVTCGTCADCVDPSRQLKFKFDKGGETLTKNCKFVQRNPNRRCSMTNNICRNTCQVC